jgi:hypothetical protein
MINLESDVPHTLQCDLGTINFNTPDPATNRNYLIVPAGYKIVPAALRYTSDPLSQADGGVPHPSWKDGVVASFSVAYVMGDKGQGGPACGVDLREMDDLLSAFLDELRFPSASFDQQRLYWTPSGTEYGPGAGGNQRMLTNILTSAWPAPVEGVIGYEVPVEFASPFPYAIDSVQQLISIADGDSVTVDNTGTSDFKPVIKAHGPFTSFGITNATTGGFIQYDGARPGAASVDSGQYAEIDFFRGTVTLDGAVTFLDAGVDPSVSDFWPLVKGTNVIEPIGADIDVLYNVPWS